MQTSLYKAYIRLWKEGLVCSGFSRRMPDYAIRYWLDGLQNVISTLQKRSFLDIGAGYGRLSLLLLRTFSTRGAAIEVDVDKVVWKSILDQYRNFKLHEGLLEEKTDLLRGEKFDLIVLSEVFEHIPTAEVSPFLRRLYSLLSDNGRVFLTTPNRVVLGEAQDSSMWYERMPYGHHKHYSYDELVKLVEQFGFKIDWHNFECHRFKSIVYNKQFYRCARLDSRLLSSRKLPKPVRLVYRMVSSPLVLVVRCYFWILAQFVYAIQRRWNSEQNAETLMVSIRKK